MAGWGTTLQASVAARAVAAPGGGEGEDGGEGEGEDEGGSTGQWMQWAFVRDGRAQPLLRAAAGDGGVAGLGQRKYEKQQRGEGATTARVAPPPATALFPSASALARALLNGTEEGAGVAERLPRGAVELSLLAPGSHIQPHCGPTNHRLRLHLGLIVPDESASVDGVGGDDKGAAESRTRSGVGAAIRVGDETRRWQAGKVLLLDDSFEHEVWNNAATPRLVLILDVWHPDINLRERDDIRRALGWA